MNGRLRHRRSDPCIRPVREAREALKNVWRGAAQYRRSAEDREAIPERPAGRNTLQTPQILQVGGHPHPAE
jgi:hypothetical protein